MAPYTAPDGPMTSGGCAAGDGVRFCPVAGKQEVLIYSLQVARFPAEILNTLLSSVIR